MRRHAVLCLALALAGCVSATECAPAIPEEFRADAIRWALDQKLVTERLVPHDDLVLALGAGRPYKDLDEPSRRRLSRYATGYAECIRDRVNPDR